jgi:FkbM family methyltransferase
MFEKQLRSLKRRYHLLQPLKRARRDDIEYDLDCRQLIDYNIYLGCWETDTHDFIENHVKDGFVIVEVGANVGAHTLLLAKRAGGNGSVHAIEPTDFARTKLLKNSHLNPDLEERITVHDFLISDSVEENPRRDIRSSWPAKASMAWQPTEQVSSPVTTIDRLVDEWGLTRLDLLKIDIDGYDYRALRGAEASLRKYRPIVYVELCEAAQNENGYSVTDIVSFLGSLGYKGYDADGMVPIDPVNVLARIGGKAGINGAFFPAAKRPLDTA